MKENISIPTLKSNDYKRFWSKVSVSLTPDGCWEWNGCRGKTGGYGKFGINGVTFTAHRLAYFMFNRIDPSNLLCCHVCDNRACVRPNHIFIGTQQDNVDDMISKGRKSKVFTNPLKVRRGEDSPNNKLTNNQVFEIVELYFKGDSDLSIARKYGISGGMVHNIVKGKAWTHLNLPIEELSKVVKPIRINPNAKLNIEQVKQIKELYTGGNKNVNFLCEKFSVSKSTINRIARHASWDNLLPKIG